MIVCDVCCEPCEHDECEVVNGNDICDACRERAEKEAKTTSGKK